MADVIEKPGQYTIEATVDNTTTVTYTESLDRRWRGGTRENDSLWIVQIFPSGDVTIDREPLEG